MKKFKRILLVDDDDTSNLLSTMVITDMEIAEDVDVAFNGEEAINYILENCKNGGEKRCPELILLDINMPVMDGFEFLETYKEKFDNRAQIPVVMLSSSNNQKDYEKAFSYNVKGFIVKPLNEEKLMKILEER